jgi:rhodanese-related sulfurtransferase
MPENITFAELQERMESGDDIVLVDALSPAHYESTHLPSAVNLPYEFVDEAEKVLPDKDAEIIVYCMSLECVASGEEFRELEEIGYTNVTHFAEGKQAWMKASLPVEGKRQS